MSITERIDHDLKEGMKAKNEPVVSTLRLARSALKNKQIDLMRVLTEEEENAVLRMMVKQYKDALTDFTSAGRTDLAEKQASEIELLERYLPIGLTEAQIEEIISAVLAETGSDAKDAGKIMGAVMKQIAGRADGNTVRAVVQKRLSA
jgi:uncharacterized protein YqeY